QEVRVHEELQARSEEIRSARAALDAERVVHVARAQEVRDAQDRLDRETREIRGERARLADDAHALQSAIAEQKQAKATVDGEVHEAQRQMRQLRDDRHAVQAALDALRLEEREDECARRESALHAQEQTQFAQVKSKMRDLQRSLHERGADNNVAAAAAVPGRRRSVSPGASSSSSSWSTQADRRGLWVAGCPSPDADRERWALDDDDDREVSAAAANPATAQVDEFEVFRQQVRADPSFRASLHSRSPSIDARRSRPR
ncbi:hypothetical protein PBRA_009192, partial [Plasmodiophora brassicae]